MNISKADAIANLGRWYNLGTNVRATYRTITGSTVIIGKIIDLNPEAITIAANGCELLLYFRNTSEFDYKDARESANDAGKNRKNKYPMVIAVKFSNGDHLDIFEFFND